MPKKQRLVCSSCGKEFFFTPELLDRILSRHEGPRHRWRCRQCVVLSYKFDAIRNETELPEWKRARMIPPGATLESQYRGRKEPRTDPLVCSRCGRAIGVNEAQAEGGPPLCRTCQEVERQRFGR